MRTIICKKCGAEIDASLGECPNCGAVYYILPDEDKKLEWAMNPDSDIDETQAFGTGAASHSARDIQNADNDELFNTRVWKINEDLEGTKPLRPQTSQGADLPVRRPAQPGPVRRSSVPELSRPAAAGRQPSQAEKEKQLRKKQLIVAAVALLAVLTLVLSFMGGLFNFTGNASDKNQMQNLVGLPQSSAKTILDSMGLVVTYVQQADAQAAGIVIAQSIKEGKTVHKGDKVTLTVSKGQDEAASGSTDYVEVPTLTGKTYNEAKQLLTDQGLVISRGDDAFSDMDTGLVISQSPMNGAKLQKGDSVSVTVSKGPEPSPSPTDHTISVTAGKGGSISPKGSVSVADGDNQAFTITPDSGYEIYEVKIDGTSIGAPTTYSFMNVTDDHTIYAVFRQTSTASPTPTPTTNPVSGTDVG